VDAGQRRRQHRQEIGLDDAFAVNNASPCPSAVVTGEHSGWRTEHAAALTGLGATTLGRGASRQPSQYSIGAPASAPRYPSNIYYTPATGRTS